MVGVFGGVAGAAEIAVGNAGGSAGERVNVPVTARGVENLAGVKLVMTYDADKLAFEQADKTPLTTSLMHIVNSKKAGRLIVVMAGARGVKADDGAILDMRFRISEGETDPGTTRIELTEVQVMSDQLKEIQAEAKSGVVALNGPPEPPEKPAAKSADAEPTETAPEPPPTEQPAPPAAPAPEETPAD